VQLTLDLITQQKELGVSITERLLSGKINVATWEREIAQSLRDLSIWEYAIGVGGTKQMGWKDYALITGDLNFQYQKLRNFSQEILDGKLSKSQIRARVQMYYSKARSLNQSGRREGHRRNGYLWERRVLANAENCNSCVRYSAIGWLPIGTLPLPTQSCECRANCLCRFYFSNSIARPKN
jgi:hypothetical protein